MQTPDPANHVHGDHSWSPAAQKKQQSRLFTWLSFGSAQPLKVAQFSVGANRDKPRGRNPRRSPRGPADGIKASCRAPVY